MGEKRKRRNEENTTRVEGEGVGSHRWPEFGRRVDPGRGKGSLRTRVRLCPVIRKDHIHGVWRRLERRVGHGNPTTDNVLDLLPVCIYIRMCIYACMYVCMSACVCVFESWSVYGISGLDIYVVGVGIGIWGQ